MGEVIANAIEINGSKLVYEMAGEGQTVLFSHAGFVDSGMWDEQWEEFALHYRVVRYDMLGFGKSDPAQGPVSRRDHLGQLLEHLGIESAHLVGCSMGGELIIDFALEHPEMVSSLTVVNGTPSGFEMQGAPPPEIMEMIDAMQKGDLARMAEMQLRLWIDGPFRQPEQVDQRVRQRAAEMNQIAVQNQTYIIADAEPADPLTPPAVTRLQELHLPVLIIAGSLDNPEILRAADLMVERIPGARKAIMQECAHLPNMEKPAEFNRIVLEFLRTVE